MNHLLPYQALCQCGRITSKKYARAHGGRCKTCADPEHAIKQLQKFSDSRNARIIDSGYEAYAREEGHYDEEQS